MTVWLVIASVSYEGSYVLGVYSTKRKAVARAKRRGPGSYDSVDVEEWTVDEIRKP